MRQDDSVLELISSKLKAARKKKQRRAAHEKIFERVYRAKAWGADETISGPGSTAARTASIRQHLPRILKNIGARSLLDAPCGDYYWMSLMSLDLDRYIGVDIVRAIVRQNRRRFASSRVKFLHCDITRDGLPKCDVVLCRDCLVHLPFREIFDALENFRRSGARYLFTTTFIAQATNRDIATGDWRELNLEAGPFFFPPAIEAIDEQWGENLYLDKRLALWSMETLPDFAPARA